MPVVHFYGALHPRHYRLNSAQAFGSNWGNADLGFPLIMEAKIVDSAFEVACILPKFEESMIGTLLARSGNLIRAFSDTVSFATGIGFTVTWDTIKRPDGVTGPIQKYNPELGDICKSYKFPPQNTLDSAEFMRVLNLVTAEPNLMGAMMDMADTLANFHQTPTNCGRALDGIRKSIALGVEPGAAWDILQNMLRVSRPFRQFVTDRSTNPRHGDRIGGPDGPTNQEIMRRTWQIVDRFIEFRKRGSVQLPEAEFPELTGQR
jgi:hypothetical protein